MKSKYCRDIRCSRLYELADLPYKVYCCGDCNNDFTELSIMTEARCNSRREHSFSQTRNRINADVNRMVRYFINQ